MRMYSTWFHDTNRGHTSDVCNVSLKVGNGEITVKLSHPWHIFHHPTVWIKSRETHQLGHHWCVAPYTLDKQVMIAMDQWRIKNQPATRHFLPHIYSKAAFLERKHYYILEVWNLMCNIDKVFCCLSEFSSLKQPASQHRHTQFMDQCWYRTITLTFQIPVPVLWPHLGYLSL